MDVNDDAGFLEKRGAHASIASKLAPYKRARALIKQVFTEDHLLAKASSKAQ
jgi:hypothetical protein